MKQLLQDLQSGVTSAADVPAPTPQPGQILVRVRASAVSAGTERMVADFAKSGLLGKARKRPDLVRQVVAKARREGLLQTWRLSKARLAQPLALGYSCAGVVEALGEGVGGFAVGDHVACAGAGYANHAEFVAVPENLCARLPADISWEDAALTTLGAIALHGFRLSSARLGESVAVIGLGLLGQLSARLAKAAGCRVLSVDLDEGRIAKAREAGIEAVLRAGAERAGAAFTDGRGFDVVLIAADGQTNDPIELAAELARERGVVVAVGNVALGVPRNAFYRKELSLKVSRSYGPGRYDPVYEEGGIDYPYGYVRWTQQRNMAEFARLASTRAVSLAGLVTHRLPATQGARAYDLLREGPNVLGLVLEYDAKAGNAQRLDVTSAMKARPGAGVGVLGAGAFATGVMLSAIKKSGASLRGIASPSGSRAKAAAEKFGFAFASSDAGDVLSDVKTSTVAILTRHGHHAAQVCSALGAGKNVFVEKPLCVSFEELDAIAAARATAPGILAVGFNRRFAPMTLDLKQALERGPKAVMIRVNAGALPAGHWSADAAHGGRLVGEGCHFFDWANFIVGAAPVSVDAKALGRKAGVQDWAARITYEDSSVADILYTSEGDAGLGKERYEVHGGGVSAVLDDFKELTVHKDGRGKTWRSRLSPDKGHARQWNAFFTAAKDGRGAPVSWEDVNRTTRVTLAAQESLRLGGPVTLDS
jgi:predicted dehydrogenase/NADPH:quinone reductase-like Zn-dependent oxidoreductase